MHLSALFLAILNFSTFLDCHVREKRQSLPQQTRSLSGGYATNGDKKLNDKYYDLLTLQLLKGFTVWRIKAFNDRVYLERNLRNYWFGDRYFRLDNFYYLATRDSCAYRMNATQRKDLAYEDGVPVFDIIYQCQRYVEFCCGLDCCRLEDLRTPRQAHVHHNDRWNGARSFATHRIVFALVFLMPILL